MTFCLILYVIKFTEKVWGENAGSCYAHVLPGLYPFKVSLLVELILYLYTYVNVLKMYVTVYVKQ